MPERDEWPPVSVVVVNRDGREHLERLLPLLVHATDYPQLEVVVADNASSDDSVAFLRGLDLPFPLTIVENDRNLSFSDANNDAVARASHEHLLLLNNDVEPFETPWLKELVECLERTGAGAAGSTLLHAGPERTNDTTGYLIQHRGIVAARQRGFVVPLASEDGRPLPPLPGEDVRTLGCTAACLLIRRRVLEAAGGFTTGFLWGWEDVDLGLKLTSAGHDVVCSGRSVVFHHESSTRRRHAARWRGDDRAVNQRLFMERWGPQWRRSYTLDRLTSAGFWTDGASVRAAVPVSGRDATDLPLLELADALERHGSSTALLPPEDDGWRPVPSSTDVVVVSDPAAGMSLPDGVDGVAWVHGPVDAWLRSPFLRRAELVLVGDPAAAAPLAAAGIAALPFPGAGNPERCRTPADADRPYDCLIVGDGDGLVAESSLAFAGSAGLTLRSVGDGRVDLPPVERLGDVATSELDGLLRRARIVVCDPPAHARSPASAGLVVDALLFGALPLSSDAALVRSLFGDDDLAWSSAEQLRALVDRLLADEHQRLELVDRYAAQAREHHTWEARAVTLLRLLAERAEALRFCLKLDRSERSAEAAVVLRRSLMRHGHTCTVQLADEWERLDGLTPDVAVVLGDPGTYLPKPSQVNVLCTVGAPYPRECDRWDCVLLPAADDAAALGAGTATPVSVLDVLGTDDVAVPLLGHVRSSAARSGVRPLIAAR